VVEDQGEVGEDGAGDDERAGDVEVLDGVEEEITPCSSSAPWRLGAICA
jgi:hypothetical protein